MALVGVLYRSHVLPLLLPSLLTTITSVVSQPEDCPCSWRNDNRSWRCEVAGEVVPIQCWQIHEDVRIVEFLVPFPIGSHDLDHENLLNVERLHIDYATSIADDALRLLTKATYLSITESNITRLPDLSSQTVLRTLEASRSNLVSAPSLTHMTQLSVVSLHHNYIQYLADDFLPDAEGTVGMSMVHNSFAEMNASSIVHAPPLSSFTFDQLEVVWATVEEKDTLIAKNFYCNIDLVSIVKIIDDPTNP